MRTAQVLLGGPAVTVAEVGCDATTTRWSQPEPVTSFSVVLVRSGLFRRRVDGVESLADLVAGYLQRPGSTQQVAHPCGGDRCTVIIPSPVLLGSLIDLAAGAGDQPLFTAPALDPAHRMLLARARQDADNFELTERATVLAGKLLLALAPTAPARPGRARPPAPGDWSTRSASSWQNAPSCAWTTSHGQRGCPPTTSAAPSAASPE